MRRSATSWPAWHRRTSSCGTRRTKRAWTTIIRSRPRSAASTSSISAATISSSASTRNFARSCVAPRTIAVAETLGSLVDKISIIELKIYHMREQRDRSDRDQQFRATCEQKLTVMSEQRDDLANELTALARDIASGRLTPKVYRQFKMYNDPQYRKQSGA